MTPGERTVHTVCSHAQLGRWMGSGTGGAARARAIRQLAIFGSIGVVSTVAYLGIYAGLRTMTSAAIANALALVVTAVGNTAANRRLTFDVRGPAGLARDPLAGLLAFGLALAITSGSIATLGAVAPRAGRGIELAILVVANAAATVLRFLVLRRSIGSPRVSVTTPLAASPTEQTRETGRIARPRHLREA